MITAVLAAVLYYSNSDDTPRDTIDAIADHSRNIIIKLREDKESR